MRNLFLGLTALSMLFTAWSCSDETSESAGGQKGRVSFKTALGRQSKVAEFAATDWNAGDQLTVYSYTVGSTVPVNTFLLTYDGSTWSYTPPFNQPGGVLRYYSWYPASPTGNTPTSSSYTFDYTIKAEASQEDLIAATITTADAAVTLPFNHILSQVNFALQKALGVKIELTNIAVNGVKNTGTYTFGATTPWAATSSTATYSYTPVPGSNITDGTSTGISYMGNGGGVYTNDNALMLLPQSFASETDGSFSFDYKLTIIGDDSPNNDVIKTGSITADLSDFDTSVWAPGKRYIYLIDFSSFLTGGPITFSVTVNSWIDDDDSTIAETILVADATAGSIEAAIVKHSTANSANTALKKFPISVATDINANVTITSITGFDTSDQIRVEFPGTSSVSFLLLDPGVTGWTRTVNGRVVKFTKD